MSPSSKAKKASVLIENVQTAVPSDQVETWKDRYLPREIGEDPGARTWDVVTERCETTKLPYCEDRPDNQRTDMRESSS